jgi:hypothetical protein
MIMPPKDPHLLNRYEIRYIPNYTKRWLFPTGVRTNQTQGLGLLFPKAARRTGIHLFGHLSEDGCKTLYKSRLPHKILHQPKRTPRPNSRELLKSLSQRLNGLREKKTLHPANLRQERLDYALYARVWENVGILLRQVYF